MVASNFNFCLRKVLGHEGGYCNDAGDPGGPTKYGITIIDVRKYIKKNATANDVKAITLAQAETIYREKYWNVNRCNDLPSGLDYTIFDYGVNSGVGRSARVLNALLDCKSGAVINDLTLMAVKRRDVRSLIINVNSERLAFLKRLSTWRLFGNGWGRRVSEVRAVSLTLAAAPDAAASMSATSSVAPVSIPDRGSSVGLGRVPKMTAQKTATTTTATGGLLVWAIDNPEYIIFAVLAAILFGVLANFLFELWRKRDQSRVDILDFSASHSELGA